MGRQLLELVLNACEPGRPDELPKTVYLAHPPEPGQATMDQMLTNLLTELLERYSGPLLDSLPLHPVTHENYALQ